MQQAFLCLAAAVHNIYKYVAKLEYQVESMSSAHLENFSLLCLLDKVLLLQHCCFAALALHLTHTANPIV